MEQPIITIKIPSAPPKMAELLKFLFEEAAEYPHPDYEDFSDEIEALQQVQLTDIEVSIRE